MEVYELTIPEERYAELIENEEQHDKCRKLIIEIVMANVIKTRGLSKTITSDDALGICKDTMDHISQFNIGATLDGYWISFYNRHRDKRMVVPFEVLQSVENKQ